MKKGSCAGRLVVGAAALVVVVVAAGCTSNSPKSMTMPDRFHGKRSKEYFAESEYGVKASPRVTNQRSRLKRGGGRDQVGKPYQVRGKWYYPKEQPGYVKVGKASWYGDAFHGRLTANGEIYDMTHLTAAHPTMPLPSYARVTNLKNGASVIVRVNDRGPYSDGRVIDMSHRAAEMLGYVRDGTADVKVEYVGRARLDGEDEAYLVASYSPGGAAPDPSVGMPTGVMIAMNGSTPGAEHALQAPMSFAATNVRPAGLALDRLAGQAAGGDYVLVGSYATKAEAKSIAAALAPLGRATIRPERRTDGKTIYAVTARAGEAASTDRLLQAAWRLGAADAMTVRD